MNGPDDPSAIMARKKALCATCGRPLAAKPQDRAGAFCSKRCAAIDLGRWLNGAYVIPAAGDEAESAAREESAERD
jgi:uncharacterized protein